MKKGKHTKAYSIVLGMLVTAIIYWILWGTVGAPRESQYMQKIINNAMPFFFINSSTDKYYSEIIPYDDLSYRYRSVISKEDYESADTDGEIYELYRNILKTGKKITPGNHPSTKGFRQGTAYEMLVVEGTKYRICHDIVIALNPFTFRPYIYKWEIKQSIIQDEA